MRNSQSSQDTELNNRLADAQQQLNHHLQEVKGTVETMEALNKVLQGKMQEINFFAQTARSLIVEMEASSKPCPKKPRVTAKERMAFTIKETAALLGISPVSVWRLTKRNLIRPSLALRHSLIAKTEIERFLRETT